MTDMKRDIFAEEISGQIALRKMAEKGKLPPNFRLYEAGRVGKDIEEMAALSTLYFEGAEFREAKTGPNKGMLSIMVPGTFRRAYVTFSEVEAEEKLLKEKNKTRKNKM